MRNPVNSSSTKLWRQLQLATQVMMQVDLGRSLTTALEQIDSLQRPGVQAIAFASLRNWGKAQLLADKLATKKSSEPVHILLCIALAFLSQPAQQKMYDDFTLVNQCVEAAKRHRKTSGGANFINACLRRFLRETEQLQQALADNLVFQWNHPQWWIELVQQDYPEHWQAILQANQRKAPLFLRVNRRKTSVEQYCALLQQAGIAASRCGQDGIKLAQAVRVTDLPNFAQGWCSVQDIAAQQAAALLLADHLAGAANLRVLDACAAPGGKSCHLLELADLQLDAIEIDSHRAAKIQDNLRRLQLRAQVKTADINQLSSWWDGQLYDAILLDAPCSASGVVRRHPDALWLKRQQDIAKLVRLQQQILHSLWPTLKVGGRLLYCTCSVFHAEGQPQIDSFLAATPDAKQLPSLGQLLPEVGPITDSNTLATAIVGGDGFFYALLEKTNC